MELLEQIIDEITAEIQRLKDRTGDHVDGVITGLAMARTIVQRKAEFGADTMKTLEGLLRGEE